MADYGDYRNTSNITHDSDGKHVERQIYVRAADEIEALYHADVPRYGDVLNVAEGSGTENVYAKTIAVTTVSDAAGDNAQDLLFEVSVTYEPLTTSSGTTPVVNKATWSLTFQQQQILKKAVDSSDDQEHYPATPPEGYKPIDTTINDLGVDGVQGVQVVEMVEVLNIDFWKDPDDLEDFLDDVRTIINKANDAAFTGPWGTWAAGEAKITGLEVSRNSETIITVRVQISRSENRDYIEIALDTQESAVSVSKDGWQYLWTRIEKQSVNPSDSTKIGPRTIDAHVATVYGEGDFSVLGISEDLWT